MNINDLCNWYSVHKMRKRLQNFSGLGHRGTTGPLAAGVGKGVEANCDYIKWSMRKTSVNPVSFRTKMEWLKWSLHSVNSKWVTVIESARAIGLTNSEQTFNVSERVSASFIRKYLDVCCKLTRLTFGENFIIICSREYCKNENDSKSCTTKFFYVSSVEPSLIQLWEISHTICTLS
jgi:hypothetical protein